MNHGFEIIVNDQPPIRAGVDSSRYSVNCILGAARLKGYTDEVLDINIGAYEAVADVHFEWLKRELQPGDTIHITVINGDYDPPRSTRPRMTEEDMIANKLRHFYALKEELKDYLQD